MKSSFEAGHATLKDLAYWINERHSIYQRRFEQPPFTPPFTNDPILQRYRFTNVFRELDKGTKCLRLMCQFKEDPGMLVFNIIWYRFFNRYEHALDIGFCDFETLVKKIRHKSAMGERIFTSAHMTAGKADISKLDYYIQACEHIWRVRENIAEVVQHGSCTTKCEPNIEHAFHTVKGLQCIGPFVAYEIASDFRWYPQLLPHPPDVYTWANVGPGCRRGLRRLGYEDFEDPLGYVYGHLTDPANEYLGPHIREHISRSHWNDIYRDGTSRWPPFELREVEHSLCEFDKYQRALTGIGRPREIFRGG